VNGTFVFFKGCYLGGEDANVTFWLSLTVFCRGIVNIAESGKEDRLGCFTIDKNILFCNR